MNGSICPKKCSAKGCKEKCFNVFGHNGEHLCVYHRYYFGHTNKLAEEHWQFLERWLHLVFTDGFVHGYKHAKEEEGV